MSNNLQIRDELAIFERSLSEVSVKRDLWTATERGAELNRVVSRLERASGELSPQQRALFDLAKTHMKAMMDCPRRMRLDKTWPDDFVREATAASAAIRSLIDLHPADSSPSE